MGEIYDGIKFLVKAAIVIIGLGSTPITVPASILTIRNTVTTYDVPSYQSEQEIKADLQEEKKELGLEDVVTDFEYLDSCIEFAGLIYSLDTTKVEKIGEKKYNITFACANKIILRHELFHIYEIEIGKLPERTWFPYLVAAEWRAIDYSVGK